MVAFAIDEVSSEGAPCVSVGCDIEAMKERPADRNLAEKYFSKEEIDYVMRKGKFDTEAFLRMWTIKESFVKAMGTGLANSMSDVTVAIDGDEDFQIRQNVFGGEVVLRFPQTECENCVAAVCALYENRKG
jgi:phosphopantetheine--protein transferase-like protein